MFDCYDFTGFYKFSFENCNSMTSSMLQYYLSHLYMQFEDNYYQIHLLRRKNK
jgi:hypothetical protein